MSRSRKPPAVTCAGTSKRTGQQCTAPPAGTSTFCRSHDPDSAVREAVALERQRGGIATQRKGALAKLPAELAATFETETGVRRALEYAADGVASGALSPAAATAISTIARVALDVVKLSLDAREVALAERVAEAKLSRTRPPSFIPEARDAG